MGTLLDFTIIHAVLASFKKENMIKTLVNFTTILVASVLIQVPHPSSARPNVQAPSKPQHERLKKLKENYGKITSQDIFGGDDVQDHEFPWMAALVYETTSPNTNHSVVACGGSLISDNVILTAAHCLPSFKPKGKKYEYVLKRVKLGHALLSSNLIKEIDIESKLAHPSWNGDLWNPADIALLKLSEHVQFNIGINPICLPKDYSEDELANKDIFENFVVAGWGKTLWNHSEPWTDLMQKLNLDFIDCRSEEAYGRRRKVNSHICASGEKYISDSCKGDSGGPLMGINLLNYTGQTEAVGITS